MPNYKFNKPSILKFYKTLNHNSFETITPERKEELDIIVQKWRNVFIANSVGLQTLMTYTAERLITSYKNYGLLNDDEKAYFYIKIIDPQLLFLEVYETYNLEEQILKTSLLNFNIYDKFLIYLEKLYNKKFKEYTHEELWTRELIKTISIN